MENILKGVLATEHDKCLPDVLKTSCRSGVYFRLCHRITKLIISFTEFAVSPNFFEGERTNTSPYNTKIESINRINNIRV